MFILVAILYSLSRMGFFVAIVTLCLVAALSVGPRLPSENLRLLAVTLAALGLLALFIFLPPDQLLARMAEAMDDCFNCESIASYSIRLLSASLFRMLY